MNYRQQSFVFPGFLSQSFHSPVLPQHLLTREDTAALYQSTKSSSPEPKSPSECNDNQDTEKLEKRRVANRLAQRKSRERKDQVRELLMLENSQLRDDIASLKGQLKILKEMGVKSDSEYMLRNEAKLEAANKALEEGWLKLRGQVGSWRENLYESLNALTQEVSGIEMSNCSMTEVSSVHYPP